MENKDRSVPEQIARQTTKSLRNVGDFMNAVMRAFVDAQNNRYTRFGYPVIEPDYSKVNRSVLPLWSQRRLDKIISERDKQ